MGISVEDRCRAIEHALNLIKGGERPASAWTKVAVEHGIDRATVYRWYQRIRGLPRSTWPDILADQYKPRRPTEIPKAAWAFYLAHYRLTSPPSMSQAYQATQEEAARRKWVIPSETTFRRRLTIEGTRRGRYDADLE